MPKSQEVDILGEQEETPETSREGWSHAAVVLDAGVIRDGTP